MSTANFCTSSLVSSLAAALDLRALRSVIAMLRAYSRICSRDPTARALSAFGVSQYQLTVGQRKAKETATTASTINSLCNLLIPLAPDERMGSNPR